MQVRRVSQEGLIVSEVTKQIVDELGQSGRGLWMLSGGSCINIEAAVSRQLPNLPNLTVMLLDERFGEVGHTDSNWKQLQDSGFAFDKFNAVPTLKDDLTPEATTLSVQQELTNALKTSNYTMAILGMGLDGHIAGLLPGSSALASQHSVDWYVATPLTRITITPIVFSSIDFAVVYTEGREKLRLLESIQEDQETKPLPINLVRKCRHFEIVNVIREP